MDRGRDAAVDQSSAVEKARARRVSCVQLPSRAMHMRQLAVHCMIYLQTRPFHMHVGQYRSYLFDTIVVKIGPSYITLS